MTSSSGRLPLLSLLAATLLLLCAPLLSRANTLAPPIVSPPLTPSWTPAAAIPAARTAYVAIHYEDYSSSQMSALDSENSLTGIRVMMHSVADPRRGNSKRDRVVLVPPHTSDASRRLFESDGLIVLDMDATLPHKDICAPKFDRIYLFSDVLAERYDRVVYFDWDVVVQRPTDELFLCGQFCMVFNSILHFVDGVMVVKPNPRVFEAMKEKYKRERLSVEWSGTRSTASSSANGGTTADKMSAVNPDGASSVVVPSSVTWRSPSKSQCWDKSYIFFLYYFGNIESAELFNPAYGQSNLILQRMAASVQLNAMMWYEKYSWTLMRGKEYRNMSNDQEVPALSLGYTTLKPFHWAPSLFFNLGWDWSDLRDEYLGVTHTWFTVSRGLFVALWALFALKGLPLLMKFLYTPRALPQSGLRKYAMRFVAFLRAAHMQILGPTGGFARSADGDAAAPALYHSPSMLSLSGYWLPTYGVDVLGVLIGGFQALFLGWFLTLAQTLIIPQQTAPHPAWRIWFALHTIGVWGFNHWLHLSYFAAPQLQPTAAAAATAAAGGAGAAAAELKPLTGSGAAAAEPSSPGGGGRSSVSTAASVSRHYSVWAGAWLLFWEVLLSVLMRRTFYPEFVVKMLVLFPMLAAILIAAINMNRDVWRHIARAQKHIQGQTAQAHGGLSPILPGGGRR